jgi:hypothetical protein
MTAPHDLLNALQIGQHEVAQERHDDSLEIVLWLTS